MAAMKFWSKVAVGAAAAGAFAWATRDIRLQIGGRPSPAVRRSPQYRDGRFRNPQPPTPISPRVFAGVLADLARASRTPHGPIPVVAGPSAPATGGLHLTWYGHATTLVEIEGRRVLLDPVWSERCAPSRHVGPRRLHPVPLPLTELPRLDAILISHDHYDHLDFATVRELADLQPAPFLVPLGVGAHLERWGVPADRIIELDWDESRTLAGLRLTLTAARHFSGRGMARDQTLWGSWVIAGPNRRVFYTGDTGYFDGFTRIGAAHGPFDAALVQVGAYGDAWPDIHMTPEDGVRAHLEVRGRLLVPVHWGTFVLSVHEWSDPAERVWSEAKARSVPIAVPRPGERIDVDNPPEVDTWWRGVSRRS
jgi:L-ascorbate metabolism protein UlaG (beta-lactamase superfamily)